MEENNIIQQNLKLVELFLLNFNVTFPEALKNEDCPENKFCLIIANTYSFEVKESSIDLDKKYSFFADPENPLILQLTPFLKTKADYVCNFTLYDENTKKTLYHLASCISKACFSPMHIQFTSIDKCKTWGQLYLFTTLSISMSCSTSLNNIRFKVPVIFHALDKVHAEELFDAKKSQEYLNARLMYKFNGVKLFDETKAQTFLNDQSIAVDAKKFENNNSLDFTFGKVIYRVCDLKTLLVDCASTYGIKRYDMRILPKYSGLSTKDLIATFKIEGVPFSPDAKLSIAPKKEDSLQFSIFLKSEYLHRTSCFLKGTLKKLSDVKMLALLYCEGRDCGQLLRVFLSKADGIYKYNDFFGQEINLQLFCALDKIYILDPFNVWVTYDMPKNVNQHKSLPDKDNAKEKYNNMYTDVFKAFKTLNF
ncbi:hypothetical protein HMI55_002543, partial [Coelomomyces lativittatus]